MDEGRAVGVVFLGFFKGLPVRPLILSHIRFSWGSCWSMGWMNSDVDQKLADQLGSEYPRGQYGLQSCVISLWHRQWHGWGVECTHSKFSVNTNWVEWLTHQRAVLPSRGTSTGRRGELMRISRSTRRSVKSCTWWGTTLGTRTCWGPHSWEAVLQEWTWGPVRHQAGCEPARCTCHKEGQWYSWPH